MLVIQAIANEVETLCGTGHNTPSLEPPNNFLPEAPLLTCVAQGIQSS